MSFSANRFYYSPRSEAHPADSLLLAFFPCCAHRKRESRTLTPSGTADWSQRKPPCLPCPRANAAWPDRRRSTSVRMQCFRIARHQADGLAVKMGAMMGGSELPGPAMIWSRSRANCCSSCRCHYRLHIRCAEHQANNYSGSLLTTEQGQ